MKEVLADGEGIGRKLDFIAQEMNREANTILSKANDLETSNLAIDLKTEIEKVRAFLLEKGYEFLEEDMVCEDGKYYPMMHVDLTKQLTKLEQDRYLSEDGQVLCRYGECLLRDKNEVLHRFLQHTISQQEQILLKLSKTEQTEAVILRIGQIEEKLACAKLALAYF